MWPIPVFRSAEVTTQESISLAAGDYFLRVFVIDNLERPVVFAERERHLSVYDPEQQRTERGTGHGFNIQMIAKGRTDSHQLPPVDESANPPLYFEIRGVGYCSNHGDFSVRHDPFEPPFPEIDFSYGLRDPDLSNYINRVQNIEIAMSEEIIIVEGSFVTVYDAPRSGIFNLRFSQFVAAVYPDEPIDCFAMKSNYPANTASFFQADFTHDLQADYLGTPVLEELEYWIEANQSGPESTVPDSYKFNFDIHFDLS